MGCPCGCMQQLVCYESLKPGGEVGTTARNLGVSP